MTTLRFRFFPPLPYVAGAILIFSIGFLIQRYEHRKEFAELVLRFKAAQVIVPLPKDQKDSSSAVRWKSTIRFPGNVPVTIEALSFFGGASVAYSDESSPRTVAPGEDYIWPKELRLDPAAQILFVRTSGLGGGIFQTTRLIEFDLKKRSRVTCITLDKLEVPQLDQP